MHCSRLGLDRRRSVGLLAEAAPAAAARLYSADFTYSERAMAPDEARATKTARASSPHPNRSSNSNPDPNPNPSPSPSPNPNPNPNQVLASRGSAVRITSGANASPAAPRQAPMTTAPSRTAPHHTRSAR